MIVEVTALAVAAIGMNGLRMRFTLLERWALDSFDGCGKPQENYGGRSAEIWAVALAAPAGLTDLPTELID